MLIFIAFSGLALGSFATAVAWRIPRGEQFVTGRSHCPSCKHSLGVRDLFPVVSWLYLRGKCRYCGKRFSASYLLAELATAALVVIVYLRLGLAPEGIVLMLFAVAMVVLCLIDFEHLIIPDGLNLALFALAVAHQALLGAGPEKFLLGPVCGVLAALALRQLMFVWKKQEGLGLGDVKLAAIIGLMLPPETITAFLFLCGMLGIVTALVWKILGKGERFPFGPALVMALFICTLAPEVGLWPQELAERLIGSAG